MAARATAKRHGGGKDNGTGGQGPSKPGERDKMEEPPLRNSDGSPTDSNPTLSVADFAPAPIGISNEIIDAFSIPPFLLPIYQACGTQYGIPWQVLASINRIETHFGQLAGVTSTAGAIGWMQFLPSTWEAYGVDANGDGRKDPYNPVDAICGAARYLRAAGGETDLRRAIFAYNHADWYVDEVLLYAEQYGHLPDDLIGSITGLTEGAHFPVAAKARYADDVSEREAVQARQGGRRRRPLRVLPHPPRDQHLRGGGRSGRRRQRRRDQGDRRVQEARQLPDPPGRLRQPLHLLRARRDLRGLPGAEGARAEGRGLRADLPRQGPRADRPGDRR